MSQKSIVLYTLGSPGKVADTISWLEESGFKVILGNRQTAVSLATLRLGDCVLIQDRFPFLEPEYKMILAASRRLGKAVSYHAGSICLGEPETYPQLNPHRTMMAVLQGVLDADFVLFSQADQREILSQYNPKVLDPAELAERLVQVDSRVPTTIMDRLAGILGQVYLKLRTFLAPPHSRAERLWMMPGRARIVYLSEGWSGVRRQVRAKLPGRAPQIKSQQRGEPISLPAHDVNTATGPRTCSLIVLTHDNLNYTRLCLESIFKHTGDLDFEVVVLDNASTDGTPSYLNALAQSHPNMKVILSETNLGFAGGNNRALKEAQGEFLVLLNNDIVVTQNWLNRLVAPLYYPEIGLVGPVTNSSPYENRIQVPYRDLDEMQQFAKKYTRQPAESWYEVPMLIFFCVAFRRDVFEKVGPLDEAFRIGLFEDEDYSRRIQQLGYKIIFTPGAFVHHWGSATLSNMGDRKFWQLYHENRMRYEKKWQNNQVHF